MRNIGFLRPGPFAWVKTYCWQNYYFVLERHIGYMSHHLHHVTWDMGKRELKFYYSIAAKTHHIHGQFNCVYQFDIFATWDALLLLSLSKTPLLLSNSHPSLSRDGGFVDEKINTLTANKHIPTDRFKTASDRERATDLLHFSFNILFWIYILCFCMSWGDSQFPSDIPFQQTFHLIFRFFYQPNEHNV